MPQRHRRTHTHTLPHTYIHTHMHSNLYVWVYAWRQRATSEVTKPMAAQCKRDLVEFQPTRRRATQIS